MSSCIRCKKVKFGFQFTTIDGGYYTGVLQVCRKCTKELGKIAAMEYSDD